MTSPGTINPAIGDRPGGRFLDGKLRASDGQEAGYGEGRRKEAAVDLGEGSEQRCGEKPEAGTCSEMMGQRRR